MSALILFAGTFDPFHRGHRAILESALIAYPQAPALVAPARRPHWRAAPTLPYRRRLEIARASLVGLPAQVIEEPDAVDETALALVIAVERSHQGAELFYLIGADAAATLPEWVGLEQLLARASILIAPREGVAIDLDAVITRAPQLTGRVRLLPASGVAASASAVRSGVPGLLVAGVAPLLADELGVAVDED